MYLCDFDHQLNGISYKRSLIDLHSRVDLSHKERRARITNSAAHHSHASTKQRHVAKVERGLEETVHLSLEEEIVHGVEVDVECRRGRAEKRRPLPAVIFRIEQEVRADYRHTNDDNQQIGRAHV